MPRWRGASHPGLAAWCLLWLGLVDAHAQFGTTIPVACQTVTIAPASDAATPVATTFSLPLYNRVVFSGAVASVNTSSTLTCSGAAWNSNQFSVTPFLVHLTSGASTGRTFLITSNTTNQLAVATRGFDLTSVLAAGDSFQILVANTLGSLFGTSSVPFQTSASPNTADDILLWNGTSWDTYYHNGTTWRRSGSLRNLNDTVLYPEEGFYVTRRGTTPLTLTFTGTVPATAERTDLPGPGGTFIANRFPVATTLSNIGFQFLPDWQANASPNNADQVLQWNGMAWNVFYFNGTNWRRSGSLLKYDAQPIQPGEALYISRQSSAAGSASTLTQPLPYSLP